MKYLHTKKIRLISMCFFLVILMFTLPMDDAEAQTDKKQIRVNGKAITDYLPILEKTKKRILALDPETKLYVQEVKENLFVVSDGVYQSAFLKIGKGVIVFDAPERYGAKLPEIINQHLPGEVIKYLVYSHAHKDHIGGSGAFEGMKGLQVVAHKGVASSIIRRKDQHKILLPTIIFEEKYTLSLGAEHVELVDHGSFHSSAGDIFIYLPKQKFLMVIDAIEPGYVPFKSFGKTANFQQYKTIFERLLSYDFDLILAGHLNILGNRQDVIETQAYLADVEQISANVLQATPVGPLFGEVFAAVHRTDYTFLAFSYALEILAKQCADQVIEKWKDRLSAVDIWAESHCETVQGHLMTH